MVTIGAVDAGDGGSLSGEVDDASCDFAVSQISNMR
jgi:hypothetical protein